MQTRQLSLIIFFFVLLVLVFSGHCSVCPSLKIQDSELDAAFEMWIDQHRLERGCQARDIMPASHAVL